eukprot:38019-Rhodomonas_salina.6
MLCLCRLSQKKSDLNLQNNEALRFERRLRALAEEIAGDSTGNGDCMRCTGRKWRRHRYRSKKMLRAMQVLGTSVAGQGFRPRWSRLRGSRAVTRSSTESGFQIFRVIFTLIAAAPAPVALNLQLQIPDSTARLPSES